MGSNYSVKYYGVLDFQVYAQLVARAAFYTHSNLPLFMNTTFLSSVVILGIWSLLPVI